MENEEMCGLCEGYKLAVEEKNAELACLGETVAQQKDTEAQNKRCVVCAVPGSPHPYDMPGDRQAHIPTVFNCCNHLT